MVTEIEKMAFSPEEVAKATGLHINTIYTLLRKKQMPALKLGRKFLISKISLQEWLNQSKTPPAAGSAA